MAAVVSGFGDPGAVMAAADDLRRASSVAEDAHALVERARPELWRGAAADAFTTAARATLPEARGVADTLLAASGTLTRYVAAQREAQSGYDNAQADFDRAASALKSNPLDIFAAAHLVQSRLAGFGALGRLQEAAAIAADELRAASGEAADGNPWYNPFGWGLDKEDPHDRASKDIMDDDAFDSDDVAQGQIGDCFLLAPILSLLNSDGGDDFIRENVRWDEDKKGFWVTLYSGGEPEEVFVQDVYGQGARQKDWEWWFLSGDKPSIAALYESAYREKYGYYDLDDGGISSDAMELITGKPVTEIANSDYSGLSSSEYQGLREVLNDGGQVTLSSPRSGDHQLTVTDTAGNTREVEIVTQHSYVVTRIDEDGNVWLRNPWGPGNSADGGGEFRVSAEDATSLFWRAASTNVTQ